MKKIFVLFLFLIAIPVAHAHALSLDEVRSGGRFSRMLSREMAPQVLGASTVTNIISKTLSVSTKRDDEALKLQILLNQLGYLSAIPDGIYGPQTTAAVAKFQAANGLSPMGVVDAQTLGLINSADVLSQLKASGSTAVTAKTAEWPRVSAVVQGNYCVLTIQTSLYGTTTTRYTPLGDPNVCSLIASLPYMTFPRTATPDASQIPADATIVYQKGTTCTTYNPTSDGWTKGTTSECSATLSFNADDALKNIAQQIADLQQIVNNPEAFKKEFSAGRGYIQTLCVVTYTTNGPVYTQYASAGGGAPIFMIHPNYCLPNNNNAINFQTFMFGL